VLKPERVQRRAKAIVEERRDAAFLPIGINIDQLAVGRSLLDLDPGTASELAARDVDKLDIKNAARPVSNATTSA
jgi:hypothetical protein